MFKNILLTLSLFSILFFACNGGGKPKENTLTEAQEKLKTEQEKLYREVMDIHDEMMPEIGAIRKAQKEVEVELEKLKDAKNSEKYNQYKEAFNQLENADLAMHKWMKQFKTPTKEMPTEEAITYLKSQKIKVAEMKKVMSENMEAAKKVIDF